MAHTNSTINPGVHYGKLAGSLKVQTCEVCGRQIPIHEHFVWFPWFPGREHSIACQRCARGEESPTVDLDAITFGEVA